MHACLLSSTTIMHRIVAEAVYRQPASIAFLGDRLLFLKDPPPGTSVALAACAVQGPGCQCLILQTTRDGCDVDVTWLRLPGWHEPGWHI